MSISKCIVRLKDSHDTEHSVIVYAESLYEAVVRGLNRLADVGWESDTNETIKQVEVEIHQEPTKHIVDVPKLLKWVNKIPCIQDRKLAKKNCGSCSANGRDSIHMIPGDSNQFRKRNSYAPFFRDQAK